MIIVDVLAQLLTLMACALIFWRVEPVLNCCHVTQTTLLINVAFYMLTIGSLVLGGSILFGSVPSWPTAALTAGIALLLLCERRVRVLFLIIETETTGGCMITLEQLKKIAPDAGPRAGVFLAPLNDAMAAFGIDSAARIAAFLAQVCHETGGLRYTSELWGPTPAQKRYEGRADLGNTQPGDGSFFRGHGGIQVTGRANHAAARDALRTRFPDLDVPDFEKHPEALALPQWAMLSAAQFWVRKGLNALADAGDFERITRRVNGGLNGLVERQAFWAVAKEVLA